MVALEDNKINVGMRFADEKLTGINYVDVCENNWRSKLKIRLKSNA